MRKRAFILAITWLVAAPAWAALDGVELFHQQRAAYCATLLHDTPAAIRQFRRDILKPGVQLVNLEGTDPAGARLVFAASGRQLPHPPGADVFPVRYLSPGFLVGSEAVAFLQPYAEWQDEFEDLLKAALWRRRIPFRRLDRGRIRVGSEERFVTVISLEHYLAHQQDVIDALDLFHFFITGST